MLDRLLNRRTLAAAIAVTICAAAILVISLRDDPASNEDPSREAADNDAEVELSDDEILARAKEFYESRPYFQRPMAHSEVPQGLPDMRAETCGGCHTEIYEEWKLSTHRRAWLDDAQFQAELAKSRSAHNPDSDDDVGWMCVNCHTPMMNQLPELVIDLEGDIGKPVYAKNPAYDAKLQEDAITCATCHVRDGIVYGPYGDTDAPHPTAKDPKLLTNDTCTQCHQAEAEWPSRNLACFFGTGKEFEASHYADEGKTCQSCHMPEVTRKLAPAFDRPERKTRRHWFGGSLIPKHPDFADELEPLKPVYGTGIEIELLAAPADAEPAGTPDGEYDKGSTRCEDDQACTRLWVRLTNKNAGHQFPTGDPERHANIDIVARTADGETLATAKDRIASRFQWWPKIKKLTDNRIAPGEHHDIVLEVPLTGEPFEVAIEGSKYRMYKEAFEHHDLEGRYVRGRKFHESTWQVDRGGEPSLELIRDDWGERKTLAHDGGTDAE